MLDLRAFPLPRHAPSPGLPLTLTFGLALGLSGCGADRPESLQEAGVGGAVLEAAALFDPAAFDSITWTTPRAAVDRGATVYAYSCAKCHGDTGAGNGGYQLQGRVVRPPSFLREDWRFARDPVGLRESIFSGNEKGSPHWGRGALSARDMDAVAHYVTRLWAMGG